MEMQERFKIIIDTKFGEEGERLFGKILILSFEDTEAHIIQDILSLMNASEQKHYVLKDKNENEIVFRNLTVNRSTRKVNKGINEVKLTFTEFEILHLLAGSPGRVFSREQIYDFVWKESYCGDCNTIMNHIQKIRKKIEDEPGQPLYIQTVWGAGYRFNPNVSSSL